jgi:carboxylesterase type B
MAAVIGPSRAETISSSPFFTFDPSDPDTTRDTLSAVGTLFFWTCSNQFISLAYTSQANVYLYQLQVGFTFPDNEDDGMCLKSGVVCHEDDIELLFGTFTSKPSAAQAAAGVEMRTRWIAFATTGNPNVKGTVRWNTVGSSSTNLNALMLSGTSTINQSLYPAICGPFFGGSVQYNFQID